MPVTESWYPVLSHFLCSVEKNTGMPPQPLDAAPPSRPSTDSNDDTKPKALPKGVVLGPDGKPYVHHITAECVQWPTDLAVAAALAPQWHPGCKWPSKPTPRPRQPQQARPQAAQQHLSNHRPTAPQTSSSWDVRPGLSYTPWRPATRSHLRQHSRAKRGSSSACSVRCIRVGSAQATSRRG